MQRQIPQRISVFHVPANIIVAKHAKVILRHFSVNLRFNTAINPPATKKSDGFPPTNKVSASKRIDTTTDWEETPNFSISQFSELPHTNFGINQHITINNELKEALRQVLWYFRAPIRYAFVYGSGVFPQSNQASILSSNTSVHPHAPLAVTKAQRGAPKMIDFIFGVSHTQHWHSLNLAQNRDHYSMLGSFGSGAVSLVQDRWGAGIYFNPYVTVNGIMIKYGVVNIDTLCTDLSEWKTLYLAGRLQKPVKILRDDPRVRLANQINLISALRTALLLLPSDFTEYELYNIITSISYMGDPRMMLPMENPRKVENIVGNNLQNFRQLYSPLIKNLPNVCFKDFQHPNPDFNYDPSANLRLVQDMDPVKRANMVRRLPKAFRSKLYFQYQKKYRISGLDFEKMLEASKDEDAIRINRQEGGGFERRIANEPPEDLRTEIKNFIKSTVKLPSINQSLKGAVTAGPVKTWRYLREKMVKNQQGKHEAGRS
ncbi:hypothetical protein Golomagni_01319 [Golovinomyces magnicellulatus]|nr:hypothetical protein Golomagni_01319 [Golovinomyces magnicellulatus]